MKYLKNSLINTWEFLRDTQAYFRDVLLMHGFMLFILLPLLARATRFVLARGSIQYLSYDNILEILTKHPGVLIALLVILLLILLAVYIEFTFLLLSVYFIKKRQPISLKALLRATLLQLKKIRLSVILFYLFYFLLISPMAGLGFHSELLSRIKIPAFILDFIFANRVTIIAAFVLFYLACMYIGIRLIFALPEMILRDRPFRLAVKESWTLTRRRFLHLVGQFFLLTIVVGSIAALGYGGLILLQGLIEQYWAEYALTSAVIILTLLQVVWLINIILSTVVVFYLIIDYMDDEGFLPEIPTWFETGAARERHWTTKEVMLFTFVAAGMGIGVGSYNYNYLAMNDWSEPILISHRGVDRQNGVQNTIASLEKTAKLKPDYVEIDIQETKDGQFVLFHDPSLKQLGGINQPIQKLTLAELQQVTLKENGYEAPIATADDYFAKAVALKQPLLIEIKTSKFDSPDLTTRFLEKYGQLIQEQHFILQSLTYQTVLDLKSALPNVKTGYILPFNIIGPPIMPVDFFSMEYSTLNQNFVNSAHRDGKQVYAWTVNEGEEAARMMFYGTDGLITDDLESVRAGLKEAKTTPTYADKMLNFLIGFG